MFDHILEGYDIPAPNSMLRIGAESSAVKHENLPYSILTNLAHTVLWQDFWLAKLEGGRKRSSMAEWQNDFRVPDASEWKDLRSRFILGLQEARRRAASQPFDHRCSSDAEAVDTLLRIAVHGAYHCGQMNVLKRAK